MSNELAINESKYYRNIVSNFIYPDYNYFIRKKLGEYFNTSFPSDDKRLFIRIKFEYYDLIYKKILPKEDYFLKVKFALASWDTITLNKKDNNEITSFTSRKRENELVMRVYPNDVQRTINTIRVLPNFFLHNTIIEKEFLKKNRYEMLYYTQIGIDGIDKFIEQIKEFRRFVRYIETDMIPYLSSKWSEGLDIILNKQSKEGDSNN